MIPTDSTCCFQTQTPENIWKMSGTFTRVCLSHMTNRSSRRLSESDQLSQPCFLSYSHMGLLWHFPDFFTRGASGKSYGKLNFQSSICGPLCPHIQSLRKSSKKCPDFSAWAHTNVIELPQQTSLVMTVSYSWKMTSVCFLLRRVHIFKSLKCSCDRSAVWQIPRILSDQGNYY